MWYKVTFLVLLFSGVLSGQSGIFESYIIIDTGSGNPYYDLQANTGNSDFDNLGTFSSSDTFILKGFQNKTDKCNTDDILNGSLYYRIYEISATAPAFSTISTTTVISEEDNPNCIPSSPGLADLRQTWENNAENIDLLALLPESGDYYLEVYSTADFTFDTSSGTHFANNSNANYRATFRLDNPPIAICEDITIFLDASGTVNITAGDVNNSSSDDFDTPALSIDVSSFDCSNLGPNNVELTVTDSLGQTDSCTAVVTVVDSTAPVADVASLIDINAQCELTSLTVPTATDNCGGAVTVTNDVTLPIASQGTTVVTWTYEDENGNTSTQNQNIIINDTTAPVITLTGLSAITLEACTDTYTEQGATATDNCSVGTVTVGGDVVDANTPGIYTVTYNVSDVNGVAANQVIRTVTVQDTTAPVITLNGLSAITLEACTDTYTEQGATATDNCSVGAVTVGGDVVDANTPGIYTVTYNVSDVNGVAANQVIRTVTVQDTTAPVITLTGLSAITLEACTDTYTEQGATATDNCSVGAVTVGGDVVDANTPGIYTVTYNVSDVNGVAANQVIRTVTVQDTTAPVITLTGLSAITLEACTDTYTEQGATATDNCSVGTVTVGGDVVDANTPGIYTVTYNVSDVNGVAANQVIRTVTVQDTTAPVITLTGLSAITLEACTDTYTEQGATATDNCSVGTVTVGGDVVDANTPGIYTVTYNVSDVNGVAANQVIRTVTVQDTTAPVITLTGLSAITLEACTDTYTEQGATATDNCSVGTVTVGGDVVDANTPGIYTVTYNVSDVNGVAANQVIRTVTVQDTTAPVITLNGLSAITLEACTDTYTEQGATATDNCSVGAVTVGGDVVDANTPGIYTVTYNVSDVNGVAANQVIRTVTVQDTTAPVITLNGLSAITLEACTDTYTEQGATATDNCSVGAVTVGGDVVDANTPGIYTVTYNVSDVNGVAANQVIRTVTVQDTTAPVITLTGLSAITLEACTDTYTEQGATATDNCSVGAVTVGGDVVDANTPGIYTVTYNVSDVNGVAANQVIRTVTVQDTTAPVITLNGLSAITLEACTDTYTEQGATATDNCSVGAVTVGGDVVDANTPGIYTVTYNVSDVNGVAANQVIRTVTVQDTTAPVITLNGLSAITLEACTDTYTEQGATATDNCSVGAVTVGGDVVDANTPGIYTVTYNVSDVNGVAANQVIRTVTVQDTTAPVITLTGLSAITLEACTDTYTEQGATATDNCSVGTVTVGGDVVDANTPGIYTVTYNVSDVNGVAANQVIRTVTVQDTTAPTFIESLPQANITVECDALPTATVLTAADNCGNATVAFAELRTDGDSPFEYTLTRTWTAEDNSGNQTSYTQTITVIDTTSPLTPTLAPIEADCSLTVTPPTTTDSCEGTITGTTSTLNLTFDSPGTYDIFWVFTDSAGNQSDPVLQEITIIDEAPVPPPTIAPLTLSGCQISGYDDLIIPTATDFCDGVAIAGTLGDDFIFPFIFDGTQTILWEFTDSNGNTLFQSQEITLDPLPVTGGTLTGTYEGNVFENQVDIGSCDAETIVQMDLTGQSGTIVRWERFATNEGIWIEIPNTNNTFTATFAAGFLVSTYYRALVQNGTCGEYSSQFFIRALPSGEPPTVEILNAADSYCLGDEIRINATSQILISDEETNIAYENGDLGGGQLNNNDEASWLVDGEVGGWTSGGNANRPKNWSGKNCDNPSNGNQNNNNILYCGEGNSFGIAYGNYSQGNYTGPNPTTLESPITDLSNAVSASVNFDQAYNFAVGDIAIIEISIDGGATYLPIPLSQLHSQGDPASNWFTAGTAEDYLDSTPTYYNFSEDNTSISLENYLGEANVRIRWTFSGTTDESAWALDNINVNATIYQETDLELTDGIGNPADNPILIGQTNQEFTITPTAPGIHEYGVTTLINDCRTYDGAGTNFFTIPVSYAFAGENVSLLGGDCGQNLVQLNAYDNTLTAVQNAAKGAYIIPVDCIDCDDPGTGASGQWTITGVDVCGSAAFTSENPLYAGQEASDPNAIFTAEEGSYTLIWTVEGCSSSIQVDIENCNQVDFDGTDDYVDFGSDNLSLSNAFSIEVWVKLESLGGRQTILSKRDANFTGNEFGYDLTVGNSGLVEFTFNKEGSNGGKLSSAPFNINTDRWYHIAITRSASGAYRLYVDGILLDSDAGNAPGANTFRALLGAMDNGPSSSNNFNGWIDEVKIWNTALTAEQIRFMMNQEIIQSPTIAGNVQGATIPLDIPNLSWTNLSGYYKMESTNIGCGYLNSTLGNNIRGKLKNITSQLTRNAPLPYTSSSDGNWTNVSTWTNPTVWNIPNSNGINGDPIDWNIVRTAHNISSGDKDITVLGLLVDANELSIEDPSTALNETNDGQMLWVTHYLKIDGKIDLVGESQLVQKAYAPTQLSESFFDSTSTGYIERDQQGTGNPFNYNYWGSPVAASNASVTSNNISTNTFSIASVLFDGTISRTNPINFPVTWTNNYTAVSSTSVAQVSNRWIYTYADNLSNTYSVWDFVSNTNSFNTGLGFTMKGSGTDTEPFDGTYQNYVFIGKPNNGTIINTISANNDALLGNPYPSAIDADQFIRDNIPGSGTGSIDGSLYFWEHFLSNNTHITSDYIGGYAIYNLTGSVAAVTPPLTSDGVAIIGGNGTRRPERYIPVSQGFFVSSGQTGGGEIVFNNNQRAFRREAFTGASNNGSLFFRNSSSTAAVTNSDDDLMKRIRLSFESGNGAVRQLLLGFEPNNLATDGLDYGYDALNNDNFPNDLLWIIDGEGYVIQGVGQFDVTKVYPLSLILNENSLIEIQITEFENFENIPDVFIYDALLGTYTLINENSFEMQMDAGIYNERFFIAFQDSSALSIDDTTEEENFKSLMLYYAFNRNKIVILNPNYIELEHLEIFNIMGQSVGVVSDLYQTSYNEYEVPNLSSGAYIVQLRTPNGVLTKKIIIK